jgi:hypothetical protein
MNRILFWRSIFIDFDQIHHQIIDFDQVSSLEDRILIKFTNNRSIIELKWRLFKFCIQTKNFYSSHQIQTKMKFNLDRKLYCIKNDRLIDFLTMMMKITSINRFFFIYNSNLRRRFHFCNVTITDDVFDDWLLSTCFDSTLVDDLMFWMMLDMTIILFLKMLFSV